MPDPFRDADAPACDRRTPWYAWVAPFLPHILAGITSMLVVGGAAATSVQVFVTLMVLFFFGCAITGALDPKMAAVVAAAVLPGLWLGCVLAILGYV